MEDSNEHPSPLPHEGDLEASAGSRIHEDDTLEIPATALNLLELVGSGVTAQVYMAKWNDEIVAVKEIEDNKSRMGLKEQIAFTRELAILAKVTHSNLVRLFGVCFVQRPLRIVTEFCRGGNCFELLHNTCDIDLVWSQQLKMCNDVAQAMNYLHKFDPQIIHRDLKSLNLLLAEQVVSSESVPDVKVSDFGIARMKDQGGDEWGKMTVGAGTQHWMAPEVHLGSKYDEKVDVYSYSMVLYEIICREIPFDEEAPCDVVKLTAQGIRPVLEAVPPDCPDLLQQLMLDCWVHDPHKRPSFDTIVEILRTIGPGDDASTMMHRPRGFG